MKQRLSPLALGLCLLGVISAPAFAVESTDVNARTQAIEQQMNQLQQELKSLKKDIKNKKTTHTVLKKNKSTQAHQNNPSALAVEMEKNDDNPASSPQISGPSSLPSPDSLKYLPIDLDVPGQAFVSSGPYLGVPLEYAGSNLIVNSPSVNEDVSLLRLRQNINQRLDSLGQHRAEDHSHLLLSGFVEGQGMYRGKGAGGSSSDIDLTSANLDAYVLGPSSWTSALFEFSYDNNIGAQEGSLFTNSRSQNSRVYINKAFIILGDFSKSPFYGTIGQMYVPFGTYSTSMVSSPLTKLLARTEQRAINIGYQQQSKNALYAAAYVFKGDSHGSATDRLNNGGINLGYRMSQGAFSEDFGGGVIGNIADSQGLQNSGNQIASIFGGFGATGTCTSLSGITVPCGNEHIVHRVPAYDLRGKFSLGAAVDLIGEYIVASTNFNSNDLTLNGHGARPQALHTEAIYSIQNLGQPTSLGLGYDLSEDALAIGLPAKRYSFVVNTSFWRNTLQSLEFRHDINYSGSNTSSGSAIAGPAGTGRSVNVVTAQFDLYF